MSRAPEAGGSVRACEWIFIFFLYLLLAHKRPAPGGFIREVRQNIYPDNLGDCEETASISKLQSGADIKGELSVRGKQSRGEKQTRRGQEGGKKKTKKTDSLWCRRL